MSDYEKLTDNALIEAVFTRLKTPVCPLYLSDKFARTVRDRIAELGLVRTFMHKMSHDNIDPWWDHEFAQLQSTPRQQCIAALQAIEGAQR